MLASLAPLGCYTHLRNWASAIPAGTLLSTEQTDLVQSAKVNIASRLAVFGLVERLVYTQYAYQSTFNIVFKKPFQIPTEKVVDTHVEELSKSNFTDLPSNWLETIKSFTRLDQEVYAFAENLFARRLAAMVIADARLPRLFRVRVKSVFVDPKPLLFNPDFQRRVEQTIFRRIFIRQEKRKK